METIYDKIGVNYSVTRCTDPVIAEQLYAELRGASRIINIGAGTGSYEPEGVELVAVEPSAEMIAQRKGGAYRVEKAAAEQLPFEAASFSHAMTVLSMHHWRDRARAFKEINRVTTDKFVAITWDPESDPFWLTRDYFPEIYEADKRIFPGMSELGAHFDKVSVRPLLIPENCKDGLFAAFWKHPEAYLDPVVRQSTSPFSRVQNLSEGLERLSRDIADGTWAKRNASILDSSSLDAGYRIVTARVKMPKV